MTSREAAYTNFNVIAWFDLASTLTNTQQEQLSKLVNSSVNAVAYLECLQRIWRIEINLKLTVKNRCKEHLSVNNVISVTVKLN